MKQVSFTLQDAPDHVMGLNINIEPDHDGKYQIREEYILALLIYKRFPELEACHRRIKRLTIVDEAGRQYETDDFDIPGSIELK